MILDATSVLVPEPGDQYNIERDIEDSPENPDYRTDTFMNVVEWILRVVSSSS